MQRNPRAPAPAAGDGKSRFKGRRGTMGAGLLTPAAEVPPQPPPPAAASNQKPKPKASKKKTNSKELAEQFLFFDEMGNVFPNNVARAPKNPNEVDVSLNPTISTNTGTVRFNLHGQPVPQGAPQENSAQPPGQAPPANASSYPWFDRMVGKPKPKPKAEEEPPPPPTDATNVDGVQAAGGNAASSHSPASASRAPWHTEGKVLTARQEKQRKQEEYRKQLEEQVRAKKGLPPKSEEAGPQDGAQAAPTDPAPAVEANPESTQAQSEPQDPPPGPSIVDHWGVLQKPHPNGQPLLSLPQQPTQHPPHHPTQHPYPHLHQPPYGSYPQAPPYMGMPPGYPHIMPHHPPNPYNTGPMYGQPYPYPGQPYPYPPYPQPMMHPGVHPSSVPTSGTLPTAQHPAALAAPAAPVVPGTVPFDPNSAPVVPNSVPMVPNSLHNHTQASSIPPCMAGTFLNPWPGTEGADPPATMLNSAPVAQNEELRVKRQKQEEQRRMLEEQQALKAHIAQGTLQNQALTATHGGMDSFTFPPENALPDPNAIAAAKRRAMQEEQKAALDAQMALKPPSKGKGNRGQPDEPEGVREGAYVPREEENLKALKRQKQIELKEELDRQCQGREKPLHCVGSKRRLIDDDELDMPPTMDVVPRPAGKFKGKRDPNAPFVPKVDKTPPKAPKSKDEGKEDDEGPSSNTKIRWDSVAIEIPEAPSSPPIHAHPHPHAQPQIQASHSDDEGENIFGLLNKGPIPAPVPAHSVERVVYDEGYVLDYDDGPHQEEYYGLEKRKKAKKGGKTDKVRAANEEREARAEAKRLRDAADRARKEALEQERQRKERARQEAVERKKQEQEEAKRIKKEKELLKRERMLAELEALKHKKKPSRARSAPRGGGRDEVGDKHGKLKPLQRKGGPIPASHDHDGPTTLPGSKNLPTPGHRPCSAPLALEPLPEAARGGLGNADPWAAPPLWVSKEAQPWDDMMEEPLESESMFILPEGYDHMAPDPAQQSWTSFPAGAAVPAPVPDPVANPPALVSGRRRKSSVRAALDPFQEVVTQNPLYEPPTGATGLPFDEQPAGAKGTPNVPFDETSARVEGSASLPFDEQPAGAKGTPSLPFDEQPAGAKGTPSVPFDDSPAGAKGTPSLPFDELPAGAKGAPSLPFDEPPTSEFDEMAATAASAIDFESVAIPEAPSQVLVPCGSCGRKFKEDRIEKHALACGTLSKRKPFDMTKQRVAAEAEQASQAPKGKKGKRNDKSTTQTKSNWRDAHDEFQRMLKG